MVENSGWHGLTIRQPCPAKNRFLAVKRQMVGKLGDHDVGK